MTGRDRRADGAGRAQMEPRPASPARREGVSKGLPEGDDGRTIVDMNVEGMPWYVPREERPATDREKEPLTREELRMYKWAAVKAGLFIALIFALVFGLFIAFCVYVWFR